MVKIRIFEERVQELFLARKLPGFVHVYLGEEAVATGVCDALQPGDYITSTHRGHGHAVAKGVRLDPLMAELYGKETGVCRGRGGSMHVADFSLGMLGANGIVGGGFGIAAGAALTSKLLDLGRVAVCFFGDGGINKGTFHEALNFASVQQLPVVYVCENNQFAQFTARERTTSVEDLSVRAAGYGIPGHTVDGNDIEAVRGVAGDAIDRARRGEGPSLLVMETYRYGGHFVGDMEEYRDKAAVEQQRDRDPIRRAETILLARGVDEAELAKVREAARVEVELSVEFAEQSPYPDASTALDGLFATPVVQS
ncbi:MAG TPA: thiamine pyrophosphate-dependent dehydrogenase E1 component subunit alpha [Candidatus Limnocylindria bacterium]|nr:thiamine pyrophosphate-dependent dehydrogenase E1 component subunit alpha [Candidatus Limnocylindria bacterium]